MAVTIDGPNLKIILPSIGEYDAQADFYSEWKEWVKLGDNAKFPPAFDTAGGDPVGGGQSVAPYFFLRTDLGWKIRAPEADGTVEIDGNLFPRVPGQEVFEPPVGAFTVLITSQVSTRAVLVETGTSGLTPEEGAALAALEARVDELWRMRGLDAAAPVTVTPAGENAGSIALVFGGDGEAVTTVTRT